MMEFLICVLALILPLQSSAQVFKTQPKDQLVPSTSTATISFTCEANVNDPQYSWRKDDMALDTSDGSRYFLSSGTLQIKTPQSSDAGLYQCVVASDKGVAISNYGRLTFASVSPFTAQETKPVNALVGSGAAVPCPGANYAPENSVAFHWIFNNEFRIIKSPGSPTQYVSQKDGTLYLANAQLSDADVLTCSVRSVWKKSDGSRASEESSTTKLTVSSSEAPLEPEFLLKPEDVIGMLGGRVLIECFAEGNPVPTLEWTKDGGALPANSTITPAGQLILLDITEDMAGTYTCHASNTEGTIEGSSTLTLQYKPQWVEEVTSINADLSTRVTLRCRANGAPIPSYSWLRNGQSLQSSSKFKISSDDQGSELHINNLEDDDASMYQCVAANAHGTTLSNAAVTVQSYLPVFHTPIKDITEAFIGKTAKIVVAVSSAPPATISWRKGEVVLPIDGVAYSKESSGTLVIRNVTRSDEGKYSCVAENIIGEATSQGYLNVFEATVITESPPDAELVAGDARELNCKARHDPELSMEWKWKQDGAVIPRNNPHYDLSQPSSLLLFNVTGEQTGTYECCAVTNAQSVCSEAKVVITAAPNAPTDVIVTSSETTSQTLTWTVPNDNKATITQYYVTGKNSFQSEWVTMETDPANLTSPPCDVINVLPYNTYNYKVWARNKIGVGKKSQPSPNSMTLAAVPTKAPSSVSGGGGKPGQLIVTWEPLSPMYYGDTSVEYDVESRKLKGNQNLSISDPSLSDSGEPWTLYAKVDVSTSRALFSVDPAEIFVPYQARVRASNTRGYGPYSSVGVVFTAELAPTTAPDGFKTKRVLAYSAVLQWNPLKNTNGFTKGYHVRVCRVMDNIECSKAAAHWINATTTGVKPEIVVEGLEPKELYHTSIAGFNRGGIGPWSDWEDGAFIAARAPPDVAPSGVKYSVTGQSLTASWDKVVAQEPVEGYKVQYWLLNETSKEAFGKATGATTLTLRLPRKVDYYVWVRAYNEGGDGRPTAPVVVSGRGGTTSKYHGNSAVAPRKSFASMLSVAVLWSVIYAAS